MSEQETWYRVWMQRIEPVRVVSHTAKQVTFLSDGREKKVNKSSSWRGFFQTWDEAHAFLLEQAEGDLASVRLQLHMLQGRVGNIKGMKKPEGAA